MKLYLVVVIALLLVGTCATLLYQSIEKDAPNFCDSMVIESGYSGEKPICYEPIKEPYYKQILKRLDR